MHRAVVYQLGFPTGVCETLYVGSDHNVWITAESREHVKVFNFVSSGRLECGGVGRRGGRGCEDLSLVSDSELKLGQKLEIEREATRGPELLTRCTIWALSAETSTLCNVFLSRLHLKWAVCLVES